MLVFYYSVGIINIGTIPQKPKYALTDMDKQSLFHSESDRNKFQKNAYDIDYSMTENSLVHKKKKTWKIISNKK